MRRSRRVSLLLMVVGLLAIVWSSRTAVTAKDEPASGKRKAEHWAVLIGVDDYAYAKDLQFCGADMKSLRDELVKVGFDQRQVLLLNDDAKDKRLQPYKTNIQKQIELTCSNAERGDMVLIAFSGHGVHFNKVSYLCPTDAKLDEKDSLISLEWVYEQLQKCQADLKLVMVDACRNVPPELSEKRSFTPAERQAGSRAFVQEMERLPRGILLLNSCAEGEFAQEDKEFGHGVFMKFLLDGLKGKADRDGDKVVTLNEWFRYASKETKLHVGTKFGESQNPRLKGNYDVELLDFEVASLSAPRRDQPIKPMQNETPTRPNTPLSANAPKTLTNSIDMKFVLVPAGEFEMGSTAADVNILINEKSIHKSEILDQQPQHRVRISKSFYLGKFEVTKGEFAKFVAAEAYQTDPERDGQGGFGYDESEQKTQKFKGRMPQFTWQNTGWTPYQDNHPVVNVTWNDAKAFCAWLSRKEGQKYRLPTEAEWEYACRAGTTTRHPGGDDLLSLSQIANIADQSNKRIPGGIQTDLFASFDDGNKFAASVGSFAANGFGVQDTIGNVSEWCEDIYDSKAYRDREALSTDPLVTSGSRYRVFRGGSWYSSDRGYGSAVRDKGTPNSRFDTLGFRVVRE